MNTCIVRDSSSLSVTCHFQTIYDVPNVRVYICIYVYIYVHPGVESIRLSILVCICVRPRVTSDGETCSTSTAGRGIWVLKFKPSSNELVGIIKL